MEHIVKVERVNGVPTFTLDGEPFTVPVFETYCPEEYYFRQFEAAGCRVFSFNTNPARCDYGHSAPTWPEPDRFDYTQLDERIERILCANPKAMILPRVMHGTPDWWLAQNPEECLVFDDGSVAYDDFGSFLHTYPVGRRFPSLASEKWRQDMGRGLASLIRHIRGKYGENLFGFFISGMHTEEWYHWSCSSEKKGDYSPLMEEAFRAWLRRHYGSDEALAKAWGTPGARLQTAALPTGAQRRGATGGALRDAREVQLFDFYRFYNELLPETIDYFAGVARRETEGTKVIGAFYAYMYEFFGNPEFGHNALGRYNESENLDFVFVTASYENRQPGGGDYLRAPAYSTQLGGKLWYHDNDVASFLTPQIVKAGDRFSEEQAKHYWEKLGVTQTAEETCEMYKRSAGFALCNGLFESYFDLHGGYFNHPQLLSCVADLNRMFARSARYSRASCAEILVVADEESCAVAGYESAFLSDSLLDVQHQLIKIGAHCDHILARDVAALPEEALARYKLVIFLNCYALCEQRREAVEHKLKNNGRTLVFAYAAGYMVAGRSGAPLMSEFVGMDMAVAPQPYTQVRFALQGGHPVTAGLLEKGLREVCHNRPCSPGFAVQDKAAVALGIDETGQTLFAVKQNPGYTSVYTATPLLPAAVYRSLARHAGVHIVNERSDTFYANESYMALHANGGGARTLRLPRPGRLYDAIYETLLAENATEYKVELRHGETLLVRYEAQA